MNQLDRLVHGVKDTPDLRAASIKLMSNIAEELKSTIGNDSASAALSNTLTTHAVHLADCLLASTPMIVATHPVPNLTEDDPDIERLPGESDADYQARLDAAPKIEKLPGDDAV